jgi:hypothetical protein
LVADRYEAAGEESQHIVPEDEGEEVEDPEVPWHEGALFTCQVLNMGRGGGGGIDR